MRLTATAPALRTLQHRKLLTYIITLYHHTSKDDFFSGARPGNTVQCGETGSTGKKKDNGGGLFLPNSRCNDNFFFTTLLTVSQTPSPKI